MAHATASACPVLSSSAVNTFSPQTNTNPENVCSYTFQEWFEVRPVTQKALCFLEVRTSGMFTHLTFVKEK